MKTLVIFFIATLIFIKVNGQNVFSEQNDLQRLSPSEFGIPAAPVFDLMGVTPSQVVKSSEIKDFKVDWSFKSWSLNPNISFEAQPIWEFLYNKKPIKKYQTASPFMRMMSTFNFSVGTVRDELGNRRIGYAAKLGLYKEKDPLLAKDIYDDIEADIQAERILLENQLKEAKNYLDTLSNILEKPLARANITDLEQSLLLLNTKRSQEIETRAKVLVAENWNTSWVDIGAGKVNTYLSDIKGNLDDLVLNRNTAQGLWINAGRGLGKNFLVSGLLRGHLYDEEVDFVLQNDQTLELLDTTTVAANIIMTYGLNVRYGGSMFTFFAEGIYERRGLKTAFEAVEKSYSPPQSFTILEESVSWTKLEPLIVNFGGDWRIRRSIILTYSMRLAFDKELKLSNFIPVVGISCLMR
jgi:hypothetical protein